jgi:hypothetical protein
MDIHLEKAYIPRHYYTTIYIAFMLWNQSDFKIKCAHYISHSISAHYFLGYLATFMYITSNCIMTQKETDWPVLSFGVIFLRESETNHVTG